MNVRKPTLPVIHKVCFRFRGLSALLVGIAVLSLLGPTSRANASDTPTAENPATSQLHQLFDQDWEYQMEHNPVRASLLGDRRWNDRWPDVRLESLHAQYQHARETLVSLHAIDRAKLPRRISCRTTFLNTT